MSKKVQCQKIILLILYLLNSPLLMAQVQILPNTHRNRINFVKEFVDKYNDVIKDSFQDSENMNEALRLFDLSQFSSRNYPGFIDVLQFCKDIKKSTALSLTDVQTVCLVNSVCNYQGKDKEIRLFLKQVQIGTSKEWIVSSIDSDWLNAYDNNKQTISLLPDEHELNFIGLSKIDKDNISSMERVFHSNHIYDKSSVLAFLIKAGLLQIKHTKDIVFLFMQVPNYVFHVKYFNRNTNNSGWLISNFYKMSECDKVEFIKNINQIYDKEDN